MEYAIYYTYKLKYCIMSTELFDPSQFEKPVKTTQTTTTTQSKKRKVSKKKTSLTLSCMEDQKTKIKIEALLAKKTTSVYVLEKIFNS